MNQHQYKRLLLDIKAPFMRDIAKLRRLQEKYVGAMGCEDSSIAQSLKTLEQRLLFKIDFVVQHKLRTDRSAKELPTQLANVNGDIEQDPVYKILDENLREKMRKRSLSETEYKTAIAILPKPFRLPDVTGPYKPLVTLDDVHTLDAELIRQVEEFQESIEQTTRTKYNFFSLTPQEFQGLRRDFQVFKDGPSSTRVEELMRFLGTVPETHLSESDFALLKYVRSRDYESDPGQYQRAINAREQRMAALVLKEFNSMSHYTSHVRDSLPSFEEAPSADHVSLFFLETYLAEKVFGCREQVSAETVNQNLEALLVYHAGVQAAITYEDQAILGVGYEAAKMAHFIHQYRAKQSFSPAEQQFAITLAQGYAEKIKHAPEDIAQKLARHDGSTRLQTGSIAQQNLLVQDPGILVYSGLLSQLDAQGARYHFHNLVNRAIDFKPGSYWNMVSLPAFRQFLQSHCDPEQQEITDTISTVLVDAAKRVRNGYKVQTAMSIVNAYLRSLPRAEFEKLAPNPASKLS